jgi:hypothetical protein
LKATIRQVVDPRARILSDEFLAYNGRCVENPGEMAGCYEAIPAKEEAARGMAKVNNSFEHWIALHRLCIADFPRFGKFPAVYAFRHSTTKDMLKFGHAGCLSQRIFVNFVCGFGGNNSASTTQFVHSELCSNQMMECVELAWIEMTDKADAERAEKRFRQEYKRSNGRRPIWDRQD